MTSILSHSALRFGAQPTQERRTQEAPAPEATPNLHAPQDAFHGSQPGMAPHPMQQQHENLIKQLQIKIQKFVHHVTKAIQILLGQDHEEPELKSAMKRFSRAIRSLAQSPELAQGAAQNLRKFQAVLIEHADMPEDQKNALRAEVAQPVPPEQAREMIPQAVANIFNTLSEELESPHAKDGLMDTLNTLPELIKAAHLNQQEEVSRQEHEDQIKRTYIKGMDDKTRQEFFQLPGKTQQQHLALFSNMNEKDRAAFLKTSTAARTNRAKKAAEEQARMDQIKLEHALKQSQSKED